MVAEAATIRQTPGGVRVKVLAEEQGTAVGGDATWYRIDGGRFAGGRVHSPLITRIDQPAPNVTPPDPAPPDGTWITVDRTARMLTFMQNGSPTLTTFVSIGKAGAETPTGRYGLIHKNHFDDMTSPRNPDALNAYYLPNVPFTQYYHEDGSAIHGTYWHDAFGTEESQGCINLTTTDAAYLFTLTEPRVESGATEAWSMGASTPVQIFD